MALQEKIDLARRELLDLTLRNPLLNYRTLKKKGLDITDEKSSEIHRLLVEEGKTMSFLGKEDQVSPPGMEKNNGMSVKNGTGAEQDLNNDPSTEIKPETMQVPSGDSVEDASRMMSSSSNETDERTVAIAEQSSTEDEETAQYLELLNKSYSDLKIQTVYSEKDLQERLLNTHLTAKTFIEERGVNTLFLALGMLIWDDEGNPGKKYRAPLVLIPVNLSRSNARERFLLTYSEEDIQLNVSLAAKLMTDYHIELNTDTEELNLGEYYQHVREAVVSKPSWRVEENDIAIGFFSFGKYLMYLDLDSTRWPTDSQLFNNKILKSLLEEGFHEQESDISDNDYIDPYLIPKNTYQIVDADSSQTLAILDINAGRNMVIQGPPGTGKSQTITNIIAESVARGKKVLFVSEKLAALEVVKRRLTNVGLGDVCLELHSQKANKKKLLAELQKTMELGAPKLVEMESRYNEYTRLRDELTSYCNHVNSAVEPSGLSLIRIYGKLMRLAKRIEKTGLQLPSVNIPGLDQMNDVEYEAKALKVKEFQKHIQKMGVPKRHPWYGSALNVVLPAKKEAVQAKVEQMLSSFENLLFILEEVCALLHVRVVNISDAEKINRTLELYQNKPDISGFIVENPRWAQEAQDVSKLISNGIRIKEIFAQNQNLIMDELYEQDVLNKRQILAANQGKFLKFLSSDFNKASKFFDGYLKAPQKLEISKKIAVLDEVLEFKRLRQDIDAALPRYQELFPSHARGSQNTDWSFVKKAADFIIQLHQGIHNNQYICEVLEIIHNTDIMMQAIKLSPALKDSMAQFLDACAQFVSEAEMKPGMGFNEQTDEFPVIQEKIELWRDAIETIFDIATFNQYAVELNQNGLKELVELAEAWKQSGDYIADVFENARCQALLAKAYSEHPEISRFNSMQHKQKIERFAELDCLFMNHNIPRLLYEHWENKPKPGQGHHGQMGVLLREFQKKTRHMPIRKLMTKAGIVIQALKPVMMMSPLSIANFIEPGQLSFDMVIFDEASQVRPVEAFGALMRSKQAVVVGDSQQMPPTNFFDKTIDASDIDDEEDYVGDVESILGLFLAQNAPQRMLRWHYRSRHESLIAVSNKEFYNNKLVVFPSSVHSAENMGLVFHHLKDTVYDRGNTQTNPEEAKIVAEHVMRHAKEHPELTLGVAAFSVQQMQAIIDQLEIKRRLDPSTEAFFHDHQEEPFFVKNLENVQGDERDIIYISIGYGRDKDGSLPMNFGPLNRDGGERRLNVLITRARQKCEIFSSITGDDIDLTRTASRGVACLKTFLTFAEKGTMDMPRETDREPESEFELQVYDMLVQKGFKVHQQVGCADFYIDLAVVDPNNTGRYLLGIECDGVSYHSANSTRDRDRLRENALIRKGWNIYRIWSTDWFRSPNTEIEKLEKYIKQLLDGTAPVKETAQPQQTPVVVERAEACPKADLVSYEAEPYTVYQGRDVQDELIYQPAFLARLIYDILCLESPMHRDELVRRVLGMTGISRAGSRIQSAFDVAIGHNLRRGVVEQRGAFLYCKGYDIKLRSRSDLPAVSRKIEYVAPEEIALAIKTVIKTNFGMQEHEIPISAAKILGFTRTTEDIIHKVTAVLKQMEQSSEIKKQGDTYTA